MATSFDPKKYDWNAGYKLAQAMGNAKKSSFYAKTDAQKKLAQTQYTATLNKMKQIGTPDNLTLKDTDGYGKVRDYLSQFQNQLKGQLKTAQPNPAAQPVNQPVNQPAYSTVPKGFDSAKYDWQ